MSQTRIISDPGRVFAFVSSIMPLNAVVNMKGIGLERDGELVAGAIYEGINQHNAWVHLAGKPGRQWMTREFLRYGFYYPFVELGLSRLSGYVNESNLEARRLDEHLGYREEARLKGAAPDGGDVIIYVMWRDECRFLPGDNHVNTK